MIKSIFLFSLFFIQSVFAQTITVAVATNVSYAIQDLKKEFSKLYPHIKVHIVLGSSGKLTAQISHGAPYHVFMSADMKYPQSLYKNGFTLTQPQVYAKGSLVYLSKNKQNFSNTINLVKDSHIKKIAIANPKTAPYGKATLQALKNSNVYIDVKDKLIYGESAAQTLSYTMRATDLGFVAKSSLYTPHMLKYKENIHWKEVNPQFYTPIKQGIVLLKHTQDNAKYFYDFILSDKAQKILLKFGYTIP